MRKIPTLFVRDETDRARLTPEYHPACAWVRDGEGVATRKYDGTCVAFDSYGHWYARREVKPDHALPLNFEQVEQDEVTGKRVGWVPIEQSSFAKFHAEALASHDAHFGPCEFEPGTYELIGVKVNGNPERIDPAFGHQLMSHEFAERLDVPRTFAELAESLPNLPYEGVVWHHPDGRMAKIKRRDFKHGAS